MSKLTELIARMGEMEFGEQEDQELAELAEGALEEAQAGEQQAQEAETRSQQDEGEEEAAEERVVEAEARASEAETQAEEAEARAEAAEQEAEGAVSQMVRLLEDVKSELSEIREQQNQLDTWREGVTERYGLVPSSEGEAENRAGVMADDKPLVSEEEFETARKSAMGAPQQLFRKIMSEYKRTYGKIYDRPGTSENITDRTLNTIRAIQAQRRPEERPSFV